jgi:two-component sensor histidine kinase
LAHNVINAIYEDEDRTLWIGTRGGLNRFKDGKFTTYTTRQGLFNDDIYEIIEDDLGSFWMSCRKGIFRISKRDFDEIDRGNAKTVTCTVFGKADGLVSVQCNGVAKPAGWKARDGRLWFPTIRGVVAVEPRIKPNDKPPPVIIEEVIADQKQLRSEMPAPSDASPVVVPAGRGEIEIHFTALSFQAPEKNRFEYQIKEMDPDWIDGGPNHVARYNIVTPGTYHFRVRACNNDGVWSADDSATLALIFQPHYWQTWWFKAGVVLAAGLLLTGLYQARVKRLREIESLRVQIAADLHDDVGSRLTKVAMVTESMDAETPETDRSKQHIRNIAKTTREIIQSMDEIVWTINPKNDTLDNLANYIFQYAQDYFQNSGVRCRMDLPTRLPELTVATQERHNLFMAVKEALNNVLKHAHATEVRISLAASDSAVTITVADNGRGFTPETSTQRRNGIDNMKKRLARIGGKLTLDSKQGAGTTVKMEAMGL